MKLLENSKFTGLALLLLLVLNSALLALLILRKAEPVSVNVKGAGPGMPGGGPTDFLVHELNLHEAQLEKYTAMADQHHQSVVKIEAEIRSLRDSMISQLESESPDTAAISRLARKVGDDQVKLDQVTFDHFRQLRSILNTEQQSRFAKVIREALHMMGGRRPQGPPPGDGPPPGQ
jgi:Spy/CpxP family protein refolding chaperone